MSGGVQKSLWGGMSDWAAILPSALDGIRYGIVLLDAGLQARFINRAYYRMFGLAHAAPGAGYHVNDIIAHACNTGVFDTGGQAMEDYVRARLALISDGTQPPAQLRLSNGRILNFESQILSDGGRMLSFDDITELVHSADRLRVLATVDDLTKLLHRRPFLDLLTSAFTYAERNGRPLSVLMIDADNFKQINDRHGHSVGDDVLRAMAARCLGVVRKNDIVGRLGGEEFAIALWDTDLPNALLTAERLCRGVADDPFMVEGSRLHATVSIGVATRRGQGGTPADLLAFADRALYAAKANGRNCVAADPGQADGGPGDTATREAIHQR
jgi:diguanylate cyclase (GGDEF)-like protein